MHAYDNSYLEAILKNQNNDSLWSSIRYEIESVNKGHNAQNAMQALRQPMDYSPIYILVFVLLLLVILIKYFYGDYYEIIIPSALSMKAYLQNMHLKKVVPFMPNFMMYLIRILGVTIVAYLLLNSFFPSFAFPLIKLLAAVAIFLVTQNFLEYLLNTMVLESEVYVAHFYERQILQAIFFVFSVPFFLLAIRQEGKLINYFLYYLLAVFVLQYMVLGWRWLKLLRIQKTYQLLYYFIYFCCLKLIPILIIVKWVLNNEY